MVLRDVLKLHAKPNILVSVELFTVKGTQVILVESSPYMLIDSELTEYLNYKIDNFIITSPPNHLVIRINA